MQAGASADAVALQQCSLTYHACMLHLGMRHRGKSEGYVRMATGPMLPREPIPGCLCPVAAAD